MTAEWHCPCGHQTEEFHNKYLASIPSRRIDPPTTLMTPEQLYDGIAEADSDQMDFKMSRPAKPGETFSAEGLSDFLNSINLFVTQRLTANWKRRPDGFAAPGPSTINVAVRVTLDDEFRPATDPDKLPWYLVDGAARLDDEERAKQFVASVLGPLDKQTRERVLRGLMTLNQKGA